MTNVSDASTNEDLLEASEAYRSQMEHIEASMRVNRSGWSDDEWVDNARKLMNDIDGSVLDLVNGHVTAMLRKIDALEKKDTE